MFLENCLPVSTGYMIDRREKREVRRVEFRYTKIKTKTEKGCKVRDTF